MSQSRDLLSGILMQKKVHPIQVRILKMGTTARVWACTWYFISSKLGFILKATYMPHLQRLYTRNTLHTLPLTFIDINNIDCCIPLIGQTISYNRLQIWILLPTAHFFSIALTQISGSYLLLLSCINMVLISLCLSVSFSHRAV